MVLLNNKTNQNALNIYKFQQEQKENHLLEEKNNIARDLHDGVGGGLSSLILQSEYILSISKGNVSDEIFDEIKELKMYAEESMEEIRRSLSVIKNSFDFENSMLEFIENFKYKNKMNVNGKIDSGKIKILVKEQISVFRVFQEIMTNALKHSGSNNIDFYIKIDISNITINIKDYGKGFDSKKDYVGHFGLKNLKERVDLLKGEIDITHTPETGSEFNVVIPNISSEETITVPELF
jgi:signal transduction histidine kinase